MKDPVKAQRRESRVEAERQLDEALEESFPASDPPATTPTTAGAPDERTLCGSRASRALSSAARPP